MVHCLIILNFFTYPNDVRLKIPNLNFITSRNKKSSIISSGNDNKSKMHNNDSQDNYSQNIKNNLNLVLLSTNVMSLHGTILRQNVVRR